MAEMAQLLETPPKGPRTGHKITCVASRPLPKKETSKEPVPFSFRVDSPEEIKPNVNNQECSLQVEKAERHDSTQRKLKLVSASPLPKTEKKKFIKLLSPFARKDDMEDAESMIARELTPQESLQQGGEEVRASLEYFDQQMKQMNEQLKGIVEEVEQEQKIIIISQMGSKGEIKEAQILEKDREVSQSQVKGSKRKIVLSHQHLKQGKQQLYKIPQIFRYCIGCQQPVLEQNIALHQKECYSFQQIYKMNYQQIAELLREMILQLGKRIDRIQTSLTQQDLQNLKYYTGGLLRESELVLNGNELSSLAYQLQLQSVQRQNRKWLGLAQQICKLNWFITLRQAIKKQHLKP